MLLILHYDLWSGDRIAGMAALVNSGEFDDDRIIFRIALVQVIAPVQGIFELSFCLVRELGNGAGQGVRTGRAAGKRTLVETVADNHQGALGQVRGGGLEVHDHI